MRICIVAHAHPAVRFGGGEVAAYREFAELCRQGYDAVFVGMTDDPVAHTTLFPHKQMVVQHGVRDFIVRARPFDNVSYVFSDIADEDRLVEFLANLSADVYHFHHFWSIGVGTIRRLRRDLPSAIFFSHTA